MRTVINEPLPHEVADLIARRQRLGLDSHDEVWNGEYHMSPQPHTRHGRAQLALVLELTPLIEAAGLHPMLEFNLGHSDDFRVPDLGAFRREYDAVWVDDAALVVEVLSPGDEAWQKFDHYAEYGVDEVWMIEPADRRVQIFRRADLITPDPEPTGEFGPYVEVAHSDLLNVSAATICAALPG